MRGITGIIAAHPAAQQWKAVIEQMTGTMLHEAFYGCGTYYSEPLASYTGWTYFQGLSSAVLPIWNETHDVGLIVTGEQYPDLREIETLRARGHDFDPMSEEWIVHLYEDEGLPFLQKLNGWFSGILLDLRQKKIVLFNDRYGLNRIYYHESADGFYFSSEAKSLLKVLPRTRELNSASLGEFFSTGCALQDRSLFKDISLLPPGSSWLFSEGHKPKKNSYFEKRSWEELERLTPDQYYAQLKEIFPRILRRYLTASKKIGVSLTGGVDSRMIMAWAGGTPGFLPCYTFGGRYRDSSDVTIARDVARICQQPHEVIHVGKKFLSEFDALAERTVYLTDGAMDVSGAADLFVNRVAREISPVRLTGNYGGEILRELVAFKPQILHEPAFDSAFSRNIRDAGETYQRELAGRRLSFVALKQVPWHHYSRLSLERSQIVMRSPYLDNEMVQLAYQTPLPWARSNEPALRLIADGNAELGRIGTDRAVLPKPIPVLTQLFHAYQEFTVKAEYAYDYGMPHWLARLDSSFRLLHLERLFLGRHKFHHFRIWYRDELSAYLQSVLLDRRSLGRSYVDGVELRRMVSEHVQGRRNYTLTFHRILTMELLQRQLIDQ